MGCKECGYETGNHSGSFCSVDDREEIPHLRARIAALESQLAQFRWRRVEDEMPEANKTVLMWDGLDVEIGHRTVCGDGKLRWVEPITDEYRQAEYWMPLPTAPEEGE